jgi:hypothetical protein
LDQTNYLFDTIFFFIITITPRHFNSYTLVAILSSFLYKLFASGVVIFFVTLIPFAIFIGILGLEVVVSFIQAYV